MDNSPLFFNVVYSGNKKTKRVEYKIIKFELSSSNRFKTFAIENDCDLKGYFEVAYK